MSARSDATEPERPTLCATCQHGLVRLLQYPPTTPREGQGTTPPGSRESYCMLLHDLATGYGLPAQVVECSRYERRAPQGEP